MGDATTGPLGDIFAKLDSDDSEIEKAGFVGVAAFVSNAYSVLWRAGLLVAALFCSYGYAYQWSTFMYFRQPMVIDNWNPAVAFAIGVQALGVHMAEFAWLELQQSRTIGNVLFVVLFVAVALSKRTLRNAIRMFCFLPPVALQATALRVGIGILCFAVAMIFVNVWSSGSAQAWSDAKIYSQGKAQPPLPIYLDARPLSLRLKADARAALPAQVRTAIDRSAVVLVREDEQGVIIALIGRLERDGLPETYEIERDGIVAGL